jgi:hypothetical protein
MKLKEGPKFYYKTSGITCLRKHIEVDNFKILIFFKEVWFFEMKRKLKSQLVIKKENISSSSILYI